MTWSQRIPLLSMTNQNCQNPRFGLEDRKKARAAVMKLHPSEMVAKLCNGLKKGNVKIVENIPGHYAVPPGTQPDGILSDEYRAGMKRAAAKIS
jgi:hypothetical protein